MTPTLPKLCTPPYYCEWQEQHFQNKCYMCHKRTGVIYTLQTHIFPKSYKGCIFELGVSEIIQQLLVSDFFVSV